MTNLNSNRSKTKMKMKETHTRKLPGPRKYGRETEQQRDALCM